MALPSRQSGQARRSSRSCRGSRRSIATAWRTRGSQQKSPDVNATVTRMKSQYEQRHGFHISLATLLPVAGVLAGWLAGWLAGLLGLDGRSNDKWVNSASRLQLSNLSGGPSNYPRGVKGHLDPTLQPRCIYFHRTLGRVLVCVCAFVCVLVCVCVC